MQIVLKKLYIIDQSFHCRSLKQFVYQIALLCDGNSTAKFGLCCKKTFYGNLLLHISFIPTGSSKPVKEKSLAQILHTFNTEQLQKGPDCNCDYVRTIKPFNCANSCAVMVFVPIKPSVQMFTFFVLCRLKTQFQSRVHTRVVYEAAIFSIITSDQ